jgi:hypothetical protein
VQEALYGLVGLPEALGERREELEGELGIALYTRSSAVFWMLATLASAKTSCQRHSTRSSLPKTPPSFKRAVVASL